MALARFGIINGKKVPVSEIPTIEVQKLDSFSKRALAKIGLQGIADKILVGAVLTPPEINKLLDKAGIPALMKLVRLATNGLCQQSPPIFKGAFCDFYKIGPEMTELVTDDWCCDLRARGVYRVEAPLRLESARRLLDHGLELDLISNFDQHTSKSDTFREFEVLAELSSNYHLITSWMPILSERSSLYSDQGTRDFQLLRFLSVAKLITKRSCGVRVSSALLSKEARPITRFAGCSDVVDYSPIDPNDGEIFIRTFGLHRTGDAPIRR